MGANIMKFPKLYKKTSIGQIQYYEIFTKDNEIITKYGKVDGKEQTSSDVIKVGKNIGKANETTPREQAELEAKSQWESKVKKGYVEGIKKAENGKTNLKGGYFPMLAHKFSERGDKIVYPAYVQPKLDGARCVTDSDGSLWTRGRNKYISVPHIEQLTKDGARYDGELYNHKYKNDFEKIMHIINQKKTPDPEHKIVEYHIFDINMEGTFKERYEFLQRYLPKCKELVLVETILVNNEEELMDVFEHYLREGYEGAIVRNANGLYVEKRSVDLQKIKEFDDDEFPIIGIEEGRGKLAGHVGAFICKTKEGNEFKAKMTGNTTKLKEYFENHRLWKDKILTVKYQGFTTKNNVPRFARGIRFGEKK